MKSIPDLLNKEPFVSPDLGSARDRLGYAFVTGDSGGALAQFLNTAQIASSNFDAECFAGELFVDTLIEQTMGFGRGKFEAPINKTYLQRVLCAAPAELASVHFRQEIQRELANNERIQGEFVSLYETLVELRDGMDSASMLGPGYFAQKRIDILGDIKDVVDQAADFFGEASSGIRRIREYGRAFQSGKGYQTLSEFLDYEGKLATVQLKVRVGSDGRIRQFQIASVEENTGNVFYRGPLGRMLSRLQLLFRGYRINEGGLVASWVDSVFDGVRDDLCHILELIGHMEFYLASLGFAKRCREKGLATCLPTFTKNSPWHLESIFNPLLLQQEAPVVPCTVTTASPNATVIITGPNSGGKTRLLQSVAFVQFLGQAGFVVPAARAALRPVSGLFITLAEHTKADQKEGRLGTELMRIRNLFEKSGPGSLVVLDELCSGTNPSEGEEIFHLVISLLEKLACDAFISTHFLRFAQGLEANKGELNLEFLKVEWNEQNRPTFQFLKGVASTSQAKHTALKLGVTREDLLDLIAQKS